MRNHIKLLAIPFLMAALGASATAGDVRATLSAREAYVGNPVVLRVEVSNAQSLDAPQIPEIDDLDIQPVGTPSRSSQVSIINGRRTERTTVAYAWQLIPRREGTFEIPSISVKVDGKHQETRSMRFSATKSETGDLLFAEIVGSEDHIFVGQPMKLSLRIWVRPFSDSRLNVSLSEGDMWQMISREKSRWGMFSERLQEMAANDQRPAGQEVLRADSEGVERRYYQYEIDATVYPKRPGQIDGDEVQVVVDYPTRLGKSRDPFDSLFGGRGFSSMFRHELPSMFGPRLSVTDARPIAASAEVNATDVMAIPTEGRPANYQGAVGNYKIVSQATTTQVKAGDPITLHLGIQGDGPMELVQAPPLSRVSGLANDFKVADDALAGIVQDDVKLFTATIRPRREGITQIPAIPFSYFDPDIEQFVTVRSEPISITVDKADQLALDSIVGRGNGETSGAGSVLSLNNDTEENVLQSRHAQSIWSLVFAIALPPLAFLVVLFTKLRSRRFGGWGRKEPTHASLERIRSANSPHEIANEIRDFVKSQLADETVPNHVRNEIEFVRAIVSDETASLLDTVLSQCEQASFAGASTANMDQLSMDAANCIHRVSQELPTALLRNMVDNLDVPRHYSWRDVSRKPATAAAIVLGMFLFGGVENANAAELTVEQQSQVFIEANDAYAHGQSLTNTDSAESKQLFEKAAEKYQTLVDSGISNDRLFFNLGNAYLQSGALGRAIANYELVLTINPASDAKTNLEHARSLLTGVEADAYATNAGLFERVSDWISRLPRFWTSTVGLLCWILAWTTGVSAIVSGKRANRTLLAIAVAGSLFCAASLWVGSWNTHPQRAVVISSTTQLRAGNGEAFDSLDIELHDGATCNVLEKRNGWLKVEAGGRAGWLDSDDVTLIAARAS